METQQLTKPETPGKLTTYLALGSFGIGTFLFLLHLALPGLGLLYVVGYLFLMAAFYINLAAFTYLCYLLVVHWHDRTTIIIRILILLSNIPVALLYLNIVFHNKLF
ncbi:MAG: hypothetical protein QM710_15255 [Flavobacterium sp.]